MVDADSDGQITPQQFKELFAVLELRPPFPALPASPLTLSDTVQLFSKEILSQSS
jgi:hypothetical protein